ncbi:hypothetical protein CEXT_410881 [Caerostris extrusa]|uniref:Uncharacterized protein n=1 Tax=Caerostris extrusa TaxID=172846 RepID=A0AAV4MGW4_CAEEX|nr:hypothetical protein CEXT_410881 [Caerostris extrusa]
MCDYSTAPLSSIHLFNGFCLSWWESEFGLLNHRSPAKDAFRNNGQIKSTLGVTLSCFISRETEVYLISTFPTENETEMNFLKESRT